MLYGTSLVAERAAGLSSFLSGGSSLGAGQNVDVSSDKRLLPFFRSIIGDAGEFRFPVPFWSEATERTRRLLQLVQ
jgi:hypothetical protein